jgi:excisionase family DNA binding protein
MPDDYTIKQLAARCRVHRDTVHASIRSGVLTPSGRVVLAAQRVGGRYRISEVDIEAFLAALNPQTQVEAARRQGELTEEQKRAAAEVRAWLAGK